MAVMECGPGALHDCASCGGQFVEHDAMRGLIERHDRLDARLGRHVTAGPPVDVRVRYVACPVCAALMNRKNFGASSGVIVDVCSQHGTWFDLGELPRVLSFVESGGLSRLQRREAEEKATTPQPVSPMPVSQASSDVEVGASALNLAADLIGLLFH